MYIYVIFISSISQSNKRLHESALGTLTTQILLVILGCTHMVLASNFKNKKLEESRHEENHMIEGHYKL